MHGLSDTQNTGALVLASTPLGDLSDASPHLRDVLSSADVIAAEDTRRLRHLASALGLTLTARVVSYYDSNEKARIPSLLSHLKTGDSVVLVTDAGMPSISDPGYRLVAAAIDADIRVTVVPGPSAVTTALAISGLPSARFCFEGFLPRKGGERQAALRALTDEQRTMVFFEAPHRLANMLSDAAHILGVERRAAVCRELTKSYEEVRRGTLHDLSDWAIDGVRGEITVVIAGAPANVQSPVDARTLAEAVARREESGESRKTAMAYVADEFRVPRRTVYAAVVSAKQR